MTDLIDSVLYCVVFVLSIIGTKGTPTFSLGLPTLSSFSSFSGRQNEAAAVKPFSGIRVKNDSIRMVYYHEQTVAVVELAPGKLLLNCELIEVYEPKEAMQVLQELASVSRPLTITFSEMLTLMNQCQLVDPPTQPAGDGGGGGGTQDPRMEDMDGRQNRGLLRNNPFTLFSGIIPGTKWCGTGDIAANYHDLGQEANMDKCCRAHDLCPVKIRAYTTRYNLTNNSLYSKSHCLCDDNLFDCLKQSTSPTAALMGNIYFNLVQVQCIADTSSGDREFMLPRSNF